GPIGQEREGRKQEIFISGMVCGQHLTAAGRNLLIFNLPLQPPIVEIMPLAREHQGCACIECSKVAVSAERLRNEHQAAKQLEADEKRGDTENKLPLEAHPCARLHAPYCSPQQRGRIMIKFGRPTSKILFNLTS